MTEVSDTLRKALALIEKPENWCKGDYVQDADGRPLVWERSIHARRWSIFAALRHAAGDSIGSGVLGPLERALPAPFALLSTFNDHPDTTHPMVVDLFKRAIAEEEANG